MKVKHIVFLILLFATGTTYAQTWNNITGKNSFIDSVRYLKYRHSGNLDSVLTISPTSGNLMFVARSAGGGGYGVDSITITPQGMLCAWASGLSTCYPLGAYYDSSALNYDSSFTYHYSRGVFVDSTYLPKSPIFGGTNLVIRDTTVTVNGNPVRGYIFDASGSGGGSGSGKVYAGLYLLNVNDSTLKVDSSQVAIKDGFFNPGVIPYSNPLGILTQDYGGLGYDGLNAVIGHNDPNTPTGIRLNGDRVKMQAYLYGLKIQLGITGDTDPTKEYNIFNANHPVPYQRMYSDLNGYYRQHTVFNTDMRIVGLSTDSTAPAQTGVIKYLTVDKTGIVSYGVAAGGVVTDTTTFNWSVLDSLNTPPVSPATGDVYEVGTAGTGAFSGHNKEIATYNGSSYTFEVPVAGNLLYNAATTSVSKYTTVWVRVGKAIIYNGGQIGYGAVTIGTNDNNSLIFRTNGATRFTIGNTGIPVLTSLAGAGNGFVGISSTGQLSKSNFPNATTRYMTGYGTFGSLYDSARQAISVAGTGLTYNNTTGVITGTGSGATPDSSWITGEFGTSYPIMGTLYDTSFQGTVLPSYFASSAPNATVTVNNGVTVSGGRGWYNVLKTKNYNYDKMNIQFTIIPSTKNAADSGIGIIFGRHTPSLYPNNDNHLVVKFNLNTNATDSGVISIGYDTATFMKRSSPLAFNATDSLVCSLKREGWALIASMYNKTNHQKVEAIIYNANGFGTGGPLQLAFRSAGAIKLVNYKVNSWNRKNSGFAAFGASQINAGARREATTWPSLVFRGNKGRYSTFGNPSITLDSMIVAPQPEVIALAPQYVIMEGCYNDYHYFASDTTTTKVKYDTLIARFIRAGITPILMNLAASTTTSNGGNTEAAFNTMIHNEAVKYGLREVDINTPLKNGGSTIWLNYLGPDNVHLSDSGQIVTANAIISKISDLLGLYTGDTTSFLKTYNVPSGGLNMARLVVGADNNVYQVPSDALDSATLLFNHYNADATGSAISQKNSSLYLDGVASTDSVLFLRARSAAKINFANSNTMVVTNKPDNAGNGTPLAEFMRQTHSFIFDNGEANFTTHSLETGSDLVMMGDGVGNTSQSGGNKTYSRAILIGKEIGTGMTTASGVIGIGSKALLGVTTGSNIIQINTSNTEGLLLGGNSNAMFIGDATYGNDAIPTGTIALAPNSGISNNTLMLGVQKSYVAGMAPINVYTTQNSSGTNIAGGRMNLLSPSSTGYAEAGKTYLSFTNVGTSGTATNSTQSITMQAERLGVTIGKGTALTKAPDAIADFQANTTDNMGGVTYPSYTSAQRSNISTGILTIAIAGAGTGQTAGQTPLIFSGGTGTAATGYATVSAGVVISTVITYRGAYSVVPTTVTVAAGGTPATFTITLGATASNTIWCSDCTATDGSTGVIQTWNSTTWKNHW